MSAEAGGGCAFRPTSTCNRCAANLLAQGAFSFIRDFLPAEVTAQLVAAVAAVTPSVNRNYLPGHKQGGSVSRHAIDRLAPFIAELYRSPALIDWLGQIAGERLQLSPAEDPHAYALYFYTRPGDHIGWHYDTSYYAGRRYTLLFGVIDESSCRLDYRIAHARAGRGRGAGFAARFRRAAWCFSMATNCVTASRRSSQAKCACR